MVCEMGIHFMRVIDAILFVLLLVGNVLGLPIWWWLFGTPVRQFWRWLSRRERAVESMAGNKTDSETRWEGHS